MHTKQTPKDYHNYGTSNNLFDKKTLYTNRYSNNCMDKFFNKPELITNANAEEYIFIRYNILKCLIGAKKARDTVLKMAKEMPILLPEHIVLNAVKNADNHKANEGFKQYGDGILTYSPANIPQKLDLSEKDAAECGFYDSHDAKKIQRESADNNKKRSEDALHYITQMIASGVKRSEIIKNVITSYGWSKSTAYNYFNKIKEIGADNIKDNDEIWKGRYKHQKQCDSFFPKITYPYNTIVNNIDESTMRCSSTCVKSASKKVLAECHSSDDVLQEAKNNATFLVNPQSDNNNEMAVNSEYSLANKVKKQCLIDLKKGKDVLITGGASTGKTFFAEKYLKQCRKKYLALTPTNHLRNNYTSFKAFTIHSAFKMSPEPYSIDTEVTEKTLRAIREYEVIFIDEVGFVRADVMNYVLKAIRIIEQEERRHIQVILAGDFGQLGPFETEEDGYISAAYPSLYSCDAPEFKKRKWKSYVFEGNYRQKGDDELTKRYNYESKKLRLGLTDGISWLNSTLNHKEDTSGIYACTRKEDVARINARYAQQFKDGNLYFNERIISLSVGMRVMTTANTQSYYNGRQGYIVELLDNGVKIKFDDAKRPVTVRYIELNNKQVLPVVIAKAITIHKLQGSTVEAINIVRGKGFFADGQLYTALSRCRNVRNIHLIGDLQVSDVKANVKLINRIEASAIQTI